MNLYRYLFVALMAISFFSCRKDDSSKDCSLSEANLAGSYKVGGLKYKESASSPEVDGTSMTLECLLDDIETYKSDHTVIYTDAGIKCGSPQSNTSWSLRGNSLTAWGKTSTIISFDCSGFTTSFSGVRVNGDSWIVTFIKQ